MASLFPTVGQLKGWKIISERPLEMTGFRGVVRLWLLRFMRAHFDR